ncbi:MAG: hypothetical protein QOI78_4774, partial [Actinomycetota bacterium]|nr:hypothetical protein [Actinomycetota bacterium]
MQRTSGEPTPQDKAAAEQQIVEQSKRIDFFITEYSVEILASKVHAGEYVVPPYQREFTWESERKSKFIESVLMGLPIPFIFFWEMPDGKLEIVDGSQRLRTLEEFVYGNLKLEPLEVLTLLSGFTFNDLPESRQRKLNNRSIRGIVLNEHADESARLDMFERINTGSKIANPAEIRRGAVAGPFLQLVIELADDPLLARLAPMPKKAKAERGHEELVSRFFAYSDAYSNDLADYHDRPKDFIFDHATKMNVILSEKPEIADEYRRRFADTMSFVDRIFPNGFRKNSRSTATPRARFEAIAIGSYLAITERPQLRENADPAKLNVESWLSGDEFVKVTGS